MPEGMGISGAELQERFNFIMDVIRTKTDLRFSTPENDTQTYIDYLNGYEWKKVDWGLRQGIKSGEVLLGDQPEPVNWSEVSPDLYPPRPASMMPRS